MIKWQNIVTHSSVKCKSSSGQGWTSDRQSDHFSPESYLSPFIAWCCLLVMKLLSAFTLLSLSLTARTALFFLWTFCFQTTLFLFHPTSDLTTKAFFCCETHLHLPVFQDRVQLVSGGAATVEDWFVNGVCKEVFRMSQNAYRDSHIPQELQ